jgi:hypothetical protein
VAPALRLAYLALAGGLLVAGALLVWLGVRRPRRPGGPAYRVALALAALVAVAGAAAAVILEARAARPW